MKRFPTLTLEGGLLAADLIAAIAAGTAPGQKPADFGLDSRHHLTDEIAASPPAPSTVTTTASPACGSAPASRKRTTNTPTSGWACRPPSASSRTRTWPGSWTSPR